MILIMFSLNWIAISQGFTFGQITWLVAGLQRKDEGISFSDRELTFIAAFPSLCILFGLIYVGVLSQMFGRRWCYILCSIPAVLNWIVLYYATNFAQILISRLLVGLSIGPLTMLNMIITSEYTTQSYRAVNQSSVTVLVPAFGIALGHVLGAICHWRSLALCGVVISTLHVFLPYFWVESPHYLAMQGDYDACVIAFRRLHGCAEVTDNELDMLLQIEKTKRKQCSNRSRNAFRLLIVAFKKRYMWDIIIMTFFIYFYYAAAGKVIFTNLATVMLEDITGTSDIFHYTLLVDSFILLGTFVSLIFLKKMSIRVALFSSGVVSVVILLMLSGCLYFKNDATYFPWINVCLLALYFVTVHSGPYPVMEILLGEIFPLEIKMLCFLLTFPFMLMPVFLSMIILPYLIQMMGYHGLFLTNSICMSICLIYFYLRLPETKGKTLQEIEVYFKTRNFDISEVLKNGEQTNSLI